MGLRTYLRRRQRDKEFQQEIEQHLSLEKGWNMSRGMNEAEAERAARVKFGSMQRVREQEWQRSGIPFLESLMRDLRYGLRSLSKSRGFTIMAVLTLGLGIGANTAIFTVINGVLLRPLPYAEPSRLVHLQQVASRVGSDPIGFSVQEVQDIRQQNQSLASMAEYHSMTFTLLGGKEPERVQTGVISSDYFDVLGVRPALGRLLNASDETMSAPPVLVLSYAYWIKEFGRDPAVLGRSFTMNDRVHTVVGVAAPMPDFPDKNDVYMPTTSCPFRSSAGMIHNRDARVLTILARMKAGVGVAQVESDLRTIEGRLALSYPKSYPASAGIMVHVAPLSEELTHAARPTFLMLLASAGLVLLLACANLANLALSRQMRRAREMAVRMALGASAWALYRALLVESMLVALGGGVLGIGIACLSTGLLAAYAAKMTPLADGIHVDVQVLLFALGISLLTGVLFGTLPGYVASRNRLHTLGGTSDRAAGSQSGTKTRSTLVAVQVAFSFVLLTCAGLMLRSLYNLLSVDPGVKTAHVLSMDVNYNWTKYGEQTAQNGFFQQILDRTRQMPGVEDVALGSLVPLNGAKDRMNHGVTFEGRPQRVGEPEPSVDIEIVSPGYFNVLGAPIVAGRAFVESDTAKSATVAIINTQMVKHYWPSQDPIGHRVSYDGGKTWATIVGIAGSMHKYALDDAYQDGLYLPQTQTQMMGDAHVLLRTKGDPMQMGHAVATMIHGIDGDQPVTDLQTLDELRNQQLGTSRVTSALLGLFAGIALFITVVGVSGTLGLSVAERTKEIAVRIALGATRQQILRNVMGHGMTPVMAGVVAGAIAALAAGRVLATMLFAVSPYDPLVLVGIAFGLSLVALLGCAVPGRRAIQIDAMTALRND